MGQSHPKTNDTAAMEQQQQPQSPPAASIAQTDSMRTHQTTTRVATTNNQLVTTTTNMSKPVDSTDMPWHVLDESTPSNHPTTTASAAACTSSTTSCITPTFPPSPSTCHVRLNCSPLHAPLPSLTGRTHQRFQTLANGEPQRLVCGCVAFRVDRINDERTQLSVLLVHAQKRDDWIFPKGGWEQFESADECARRECLEEGGVEGSIVMQLEPIEFTSKKGKHSRFTPFLLQVEVFHRHFAEEHKRKRKWVPYEEVDSLMQRQETQTIWRSAKEALRKYGFIDANGHATFKQPNTTTTSPPPTSSTDASTVSNQLGLIQ